MSSNSDFSSWDDSDLNLDLLLGDYTASDIESGDDYVPAAKTSNTTKETATASACKSERQSIYQCPECDKTYSSVSGFRGHLRTKHSLSKITEKNCTFDWTNECNEAFEKLQMTLMSAPILGYPDMTKQFILDTDASGFGIGAVLSQIHEGKEVVVAYYSKAQRQYCVTRRELLADQKEIDNSDETFETVDFLRMAKVQDSQKASCSNKTDSAMWYEHKTNEEMFEAQKSDNVLFNLFRLKSDNNNRPEWADVALHDVKLKKYWSQWDRIVLINNVLYRKWINTTTEESNLQFIVPEIWKENIMKMLHDDIQVGHFGIHKTVARAQNRFYWVNHKDEITKWVQNCIVCNSRKQPPRKAKSKMKQYNVGAPMERVALNIIGPSPISYKNNKINML
ncbi:unnamed protein product [Mytilus edulis]|uniref:C2H2-type domain-containing protein n=1 Tax=Mytilus edulis TaxID=6550 RepID=A0A8S3RQU3_MYTED|nr:unnamed protein product [Mytilus edulis]